MKDQIFAHNMKRVAATITAVLLLIFFQSPIIIHAQTNPETVVEPQAIICPNTGTGISSPTGSAALTYTFNPQTCLWENPYYIWNPVTKVTTPRYNTGYAYNPTTGKNEKTNWVYSPALGTYKAIITVEQTVVANTGPGSTNTTAPNREDSGNISNTGPDSSNTINDPAGDTTINNTGPNSNNTANTGTIDTTGPNSDNTIDSNNSGSTTLDNNLNLNVHNSVTGLAVSGNALVSGNTLGGNATSGEASSMANILNMVQSAAGMNGVTPNFYTANIQGGHYGDIVINPSQLAGQLNGVCNCSDDLTINNKVDANIVNDVDLVAQSGSATVTKNTTGGNAKTGDATVVANVINMVNSSIATGQSFIGVLNIDGDFEGDVLIAGDVLDQLIAANVPTVNLCLTCGGENLTIDNSNSTKIDTKVNAIAQSGTAEVSNNTSAGSAQSGSAETNVTVFNITGSQVIADNALLVFVNVLGEWVGFITNAPNGATAAAIGSGVLSKKSASPYVSLPQGSDSTTINNSTDVSIQNNINATAISGDASVVSNTFGGDASSGDANVAINNANFVNSSFGLNGWFGILFINVFGNWHGSFGTDTAFGNPPVLPGVIPSPTLSGANSNGGAKNTTTNNGAVRVFSINSITPSGQISFTEQIVGTQSSTTETQDAEVTTVNKSDVQNGSVLGDTQEAQEAVAEVSAANTAVYFIVGVAAAVVLFGERMLAYIKSSTA